MENRDDLLHVRFFFLAAIILLRAGVLAALTWVISRGAFRL